MGAYALSQGKKKKKKCVRMGWVEMGVRVGVLVLNPFFSPQKGGGGLGKRESGRGFLCLYVCAI